MVAAISPYEEARAKAKELIGDCLMTFIHCPVNVCIARDVKGLYAKAIGGKIPNFTGISDPYEEPEEADIVVDTANKDVEECAADIVMELVDRGYISL